VIKGYEESEVCAREEIEYVYTEFSLVVSIAIRIEELFSNQVVEHNMLVSMLGLD
jgi:hypothetical protein